MNYISVLLEAILKYLSVIFLLFITFVALIVLVAIVLVCCCNKKNIKWMFKHYKLTLVLIVVVIIGIASFAHICGGDWTYIIPVAIALASITFPLLNDAKRRNDSKQEAFDYFCLAITPLPDAISKFIEEIDKNLASEKDENIYLSMHPKLNSRFYNSCNLTDLNSFCRDNNLKKELQDVLFDIENVSSISDYLRQIYSNYIDTIKTEEKAWKQWTKLIFNVRNAVEHNPNISKVKVETYEGKGSMTFKEVYVYWSEKLNKDARYKLVSSKIISKKLGEFIEYYSSNEKNYDDSTKQHFEELYKQAKSLKDKFDKNDTTADLESYILFVDSEVERVTKNELIDVRLKDYCIQWRGEAQNLPVSWLKLEPHIKQLIMICFKFMDNKEIDSYTKEVIRMVLERVQPINDACRRMSIKKEDVKKIMEDEKLELVRIKQGIDEFITKSKEVY